MDEFKERRWRQRFYNLRRAFALVRFPWIREVRIFGSGLMDNFKNSQYRIMST